METVTQVTLRNHGIAIDAVSVGDTYTGQALEFARSLQERGATFDKALIDRFDGLVIQGAGGSYHFTTPICGYGGTGPRTSAQILEMFQFGSIDSIMDRISHGDNGAMFTLYR